MTLVFLGADGVCGVVWVWWFGYPVLFRGPPFLCPAAPGRPVLWVGLSGRGCCSLGPVLRVLVFVMSSFSPGFVLPLVSSSRSARAASLASALAASRAAVPDPVVSSGPSSFVPASLVVGRLVRESSSFERVSHGVVASVSRVAGAEAGVYSAVVVRLESGVSFRCLASGLGGSGSLNWVALCASLIQCRDASAHVTLLGATGAGGRVCPGFFCGVQVNSYPA